MFYPDYYPVLDVFRSNYIDNRFFALVYLFNKNGVIKSIGKDNNAKFYLRSLFKPIQTSILDEKIISYFNFNDKELAVMQGSHSGQKCHIELVQSILDKINLSEKDLLCPVIPPLNTKGVSNYTRLHNNCSGKHAMMLSYCVYHNLDIKNYNDFSHPVQLKIKEKLLNYADTKDYIQTKDGCTVPVFGLKIADIARAFLNFYSDTKNEKIITAYKSNPYIIGGEDDFSKRSDTKIMELSPSLISKVGAGGFIYVYNTDLKEILIIKMSQDNNRAREIIALETLYKLNWLNERFYDDKIYTEDNEIIGNYVLNSF